MRAACLAQTGGQTHQCWLSNCFCDALSFEVRRDATAKLLLLVRRLFVLRRCDSGVEDAVQLANLTLLCAAQPSSERSSERGHVARHAQNLRHRTGEVSHVQPARTEKRTLRQSARSLEV